MSLSDAFLGLTFFNFCTNKNSDYFFRPFLSLHKTLNKVSNRLPWLQSSRKNFKLRLKLRLEINCRDLKVGR